MSHQYIKHVEGFAGARVTNDLTYRLNVAAALTKACAGIRWGALTGGVLTAVHLIRRRHSRANSHTTASAMPGPTSCCPGDELWTLEDVTAVEAGIV